MGTISTAEIRVTASSFQASGNRLKGVLEPEFVKHCFWIYNFFMLWMVLLNLDLLPSPPMLLQEEEEVDEMTSKG